MLDSPEFIYSIAVGFILLCLVAPPLLAARKGYAWYLWSIAGVPGLIALAFLPFVNRSNVPPELNRSRQQTGNTVGTVLSAIGLLFILVQVRSAIMASGIGRGGSLADYPPILVNLAVQLPMLIVCMAALILAMNWFSKCPKASILTMIGVCILCFNGIVMTAIQTWLPRYWTENREGSYSDFQSIITIIAIIRNAMSAAGSLLLLLAVFAGRSDKLLVDQESRHGDTNA